MLKKHILILFFLYPIVLFAQSSPTRCEFVFVKMEQRPSFVISPEAYADTLAVVLQKRNFRFRDDSITYLFVLTKDALMYDLEVYTGSISKENILRKTILQYAYLFNPAIQNGHKVCASVRMKLKFLDKKIYVNLTP